jgi:hypothetical protein
MNKTMTGIALAMGAAAMFTVAPVFADTAEAAPMVACKGVNSCKGTGACKTADNACKGQNACKGKGVTQMSADDCTKAGGTH